MFNKEETGKFQLCWKSMEFMPLTSTGLKFGSRKVYPTPPPPKSGILKLIFQTWMVTFFSRLKYRIY